MGKPLGVALLIVGIIILVWGFSASQSVGSSLSRFFTGSPTDRSVWLIFSGIVCTVLGAFSTFLRSD